MNSTYSKAYTEVLEIISHFSKEEYDKIPKEKIKFYTANKDNNYVFKINPNINLSKQNISPEANAILVSIYREYFANEKQKEVLNQLLIQNQKLHNEEKVGFNPDEIFRDNLEDDNIANDNLLQLEVIDEKWYRKILDFIKSLFSKN